MDEIIEVQKLEVSMGSNTATEKVCELRSPFAILLGLYCSSWIACSINSRLVSFTG